MIETVLDFFFPKSCGICNKLGKRWICPKCYYKIKKLEKVGILNSKSYPYKKIIYQFKYEGIIREKILDYKFNDNAFLYNMFSELLLKNKKICSIIREYDIIIPVPMYVKNKRKRGYNQTELIAKKIAKELNLEFDNDILIKSKNTKRQSSLKESERINNVKNVYELKNPQKINNKKILLFDDICTTGSTVLECSKELKKGKTKEISILVIAKSNNKKGDKQWKN